MGRKVNLWAFRPVMFVALMGLAAWVGFSVAMALATTPDGLPDGWVRPIVSANASPAVTEDDPGWDCLRQGNQTCKISGVLVTSLEGLPDGSDPLGRCLWWHKRLSEIDPESPTFVDAVCEPLRQQLG